MGENVNFKGNVVIGAGCRIGDNVTISDSVIWNDTVIGDNVILQDAVIGARCKVRAGSRSLQEQSWPAGLQCQCIGLILK